jgi:hypothetical protein
LPAGGTDIIRPNYLVWAHQIGLRNLPSRKNAERVRRATRRRRDGL